MSQKTPVPNTPTPISQDLTHFYAEHFIFANPVARFVRAKAGGFSRDQVLLGCWEGSTQLQGGRVDMIPSLGLLAHLRREDGLGWVPGGSNHLHLRIWARSPRALGPTHKVCFGSDAMEGIIRVLRV